MKNRIEEIRNEKGIRQEDQDHLFEAFSRADTKANVNIEGTGLGLAIVKSIVDSMNGSVGVRSIYGKGSEFWVKLPVRYLGDEILPDDFMERRTAEDSVLEACSFTAPDAKILAVDDNQSNLTIVRLFLKRTGIVPDLCSSGNHAIELCREKKYDLILLDHMMPQPDGIETLHIIRSDKDSLNKDTRAVVLTANAVAGSRQMYMDAGFADYLTKPLDPGLLEETVKNNLPKEKVREREEGTEDIASEGTALPSWLHELEGIDTQEGVGHCGSEAAYLDTVKVFAESASSGIEDIEGYFQSEDWPNYTTKVHALKSTARIIGARLLSEMAKRLEYAGNAGEIGIIKVETPALLSVYHSFAEKLAPLCPPKQRAEEKVPIDEEMLREAYDTLKEFVASFDYDSVMFVLESLEGYRLPEDEEKRYQSFKAAVEKLEWEKAGQILADV